MKDVFSAWEKIINVEEISRDQVDYVSEMPIWYNKNSQIDNKSVFYRTRYDEGIRLIGELLKPNNEFYSYHEFNEDLGIATMF